ncbi:DJ-1/PfpI family protein [Streptomyces phaeochromogenes]|uniref:DJ-1/PfpI family protein n=1 Tax=Streptomyces phaeochromogenes TaxID=1923 RepID=UPI003724532A
MSSRSRCPPLGDRFDGEEPVDGADEAVDDGGEQERQCAATVRRSAAVLYPSARTSGQYTGVVCRRCQREGQPGVPPSRAPGEQCQRARIASLCSGAFVLAAAGLLDGRPAATHWMYAEELRRRHPYVRVDDRSLYVDDGSILTSAGTAAAIDLGLHIVRGDYGTAAASAVGRRMVVAPHREGDQTHDALPSAPVRPQAEGLGPVLDWALTHSTVR